MDELLKTRIVILDENDEDIQVSSADSGSKRPAAKGSSLISAVHKEELIIDKIAYAVFLGSSRISFPKKEFELLLLLASKPEKVFKREEILKNIWGDDFKSKDSRSLDVHIRMIRKKLDNRFITTIRGVGYKLVKF